MYLKIHIKENQKIVACCDKELIGTILENDKYSIDLKSHSQFYKGKLSTKKELEKALENFDSANLVGKKSVGVALSKNLILEKQVIHINNFPFTQIYRI
ncbi:MAG: DUF424 family protein [Candidatus Micrarchaeia archaeon]|jgi:hypothetical protein